MSDYTPTTEVIRHALAFPRERLGEPRPIKAEAFDRWLEQVKAYAWEEGHYASGTACEHAYGGHPVPTCPKCSTRNPYRKDKKNE